MFSIHCVLVDLLKAARDKGQKYGHYAASIQVSPKSMEIYCMHMQLILGSPFQDPGYEAMMYLAIIVGYLWAFITIPLFVCHSPNNCIPIFWSVIMIIWHETRALYILYQ